MAQEQIANIIDDIKLTNSMVSQYNDSNNNHIQSSNNINNDTESNHSNDSNSLIPSEYQNILLSHSNIPNNQYDNFKFVSGFKCPQNHKLLSYSKGRGNCVKCNKDLLPIPCRYCIICNYAICLQCYTVSPSNCFGNHGLSEYSPESKHDLFCDVCGCEVPPNDTTHSCRKCDYDICSKCYVPRVVLHNIDLNNIPLEPYKYDIVFANNSQHNNDDIIDEKSAEEEDKLIIKDLDSIHFNCEFNDIDKDFNVQKEEDLIDNVVAEIDKIRDEVIDLEQEIYKKKRVIAQLRRIELTKRSQINEVQAWMKQNKLLWESFKLRWQEWNLECFIEFVKRIELKCSTFVKYYNGNDINCKIKIEKYMETHNEKFGSNIFYGGDHLELFNELSLYRIGITNDEDCNIIYEQIRKLIKFDKKHNHRNHRKRKKKSSKKKKKSHRNKRKYLENELDVPEFSSYDESGDDKDIYDENGYYNNELLMFLKSIKLEMYYNKLVNDGFDDINALNILERNDLVQLGMKNGHIKKLLKNIQMLNEKNNQNSNKSLNNSNQIEGQYFYPSPK